MATGNTHNNVVKIGYVILMICSQSDRQTDRRKDRHTHTNKHTDITKLHSPTRGKVIIKN